MISEHLEVESFSSVKKNSDSHPSTAKPRKETGRLNQFGDKKAYRKRIKVTEWKWQCSECGHIMPLAAEPPVRCSNRETCGRMLHPEPESGKN
jgi:hypothetical protein